MIRNVILIVLDGVRADHLSCYGYHLPTSPTMDELARHGMVWENAYATSSWTKPSIASVLSGLYPSQHSVMKGPKRTRGRDSTLTDALPYAAPHIAEMFAQEGVHCGAFLNNVQLDVYTNFHRGFEVYLPICGKVDRQLELFGEWLETTGREPFFAYLHWMETHWPYKPRRRHVEEFGGNRDTNRFASMSALALAKFRREIKTGMRALSQADQQEFIRLYDAAIRRLDGKVKIVRRMLQDRGRDENTALVITADHGEEFLEHGSIGHGQSLYIETTRVPLIIFLPHPGGPQRRFKPVSHADLPRTMLALAGLHPDFPGVNLIDGKNDSLAYCELSAGKAFHRAVASQRWRLHRKAWSEDPGEPAVDFARRICQGQYVAIQKTELYDLANDPAENVNLAFDPANQGVIENMSMLMDVQGRYRAEGSYAAEVDATVSSRLRALGYIE